MIAVYTQHRLDYVWLQLFAMKREWKGWLLSSLFLGFLMTRLHRPTLPATSADMVIGGILWLVSSLLIGVAILLFLLLLIFWKASTRSGVTGPRRLELTPDVLRHESDFSKAEVTWPFVRSLHRTRRHVFFQLPNGACYPVPRRAFASPDEDRAFWTYAEQQFALTRIPPGQASTR